MSRAMIAKSEELQEALHLESVGKNQKAIELLVTCASRDPRNLEVIQTLLRNLEKRFGPTREQHPTQGEFGLELQRAWKNKNWSELLVLAPHAVAANPYHVPTLLAAADASANEGLFDHELAFLEAARKAAPLDSQVLRRCAMVYEDRQDFADALVCWRQLEDLHPDEDEIRCMITQLTIADCRNRSGIAHHFSEQRIDDTQQADESANAAQRRARRAWQPSEQTTEDVLSEIIGVNAKLRHATMQQMEAAVREAPAVADNYLRLAALYLEKGRDYDAERILSKGRSETDDDPRVRHLWEDTRMARLETKINLAKKHAEVQHTPEILAELEDLCRTRDRLEMEVFSNRSERDPNNASLHFQLGSRMAQSGNLRTACHHFRKALHNPQQQGAAAFELAECLKQIGEIQDALKHYRLAADSPGEVGRSSRKTTALFRAGELAAQAKLRRLARHYLTAVLQIAPDHAEAQALLKKIQQKIESESQSEAQVVASEMTESSSV